MTDLRWPLNVPVLSDAMVTLRAHAPADLDRIVEMGSDATMQEFTTVPSPYRRADAERFVREFAPRAWDDGTAMAWAVEFEGRFAGNVDLRGEDALVDIGFALHPDCRGHGVMTAAVNLAVDHAFVEAGKEAVQWEAMAGNVASLRVAHATGFRLHAAIPDLALAHGRPHEMWFGSRRFGDAPVPRTTWDASTIDAGDLVLRPAAEADLPRWTEAERDPVTARWSARSGVTVERIRDDWHSGVWGRARGVRADWTIADRATDAYLGTVSIVGIENGSGEVGYVLHPDARGRGVMTRAVRAATAHAFDPAGLDLRRLDVYCAAENAPSRSVAVAAGYVECGRRSAIEPLADGSFADLVGYERLRRAGAH